MRSNQEQNPGTENPNGAELPSYNDSDILVSVSGKDADIGYRVILPGPQLPASLDPALATATYSGLYREFISPAQNAAAKAAKGEYKVKRVEGEGESAKEVEVALSVPEALADFAKGFKPSEDRELPTIGAKRMAITRDMVKTAMAARGLPTDDASVAGNIEPWLAGPKGTGANRAARDKALHDFITSTYVVQKKGKGKAEDGSPAAAAPQDW